MTPRGSLLVVSLAMFGIVAGDLHAQSSSGQTQPPPPKPAPQTTSGQTTTGTTTSTDGSSTTADLPVDVARIRAGLKRPQPIRFDAQNLRFYMVVTAPPVTFTSLVGHFDLMKGPVAYKSMTGREFMEMTTPREMYSAAGIKPTDLLQFGLTNWAAQTLIRKAYEDIKNAKDDKEIAAIRARIDRELAALAGKGGGG